jgi:hypothetical protein
VAIAPFEKLVKVIIDHPRGAQELAPHTVEFIRLAQLVEKRKCAVGKNVWLGLREGASRDDDDGGDSKWHVSAAGVQSRT